MIEFRQPTEDDIRELVANMRPLDVAECNAGGVTDLLGCVVEGVRHSSPCWTATVDGKVAAILGARPIGSLITPVAAVWLLGTPVLTKHHRALARHAPRYIRAMLNAYPHLVNFVHAENAPAVRFLRHAGFTLHEPVPYGPHGALFHPFEMRHV